jgi:hypothetical protein
MESLSLNKLTAAALLGLSLGALSLLVGTTAQADGKAVVIAEVKPSEVKPAEIQAGDIKTTDAAKGGVDPDFKKLDANNDAKISAKEAVKDKNLSAIYDAVDANHDGGISADEYASFKSAMSNTKTLESTPATN